MQFKTRQVQGFSNNNLSIYIKIYIHYIFSIYTHTIYRYPIPYIVYCHYRICSHRRLKISTDGTHNYHNDGQKAMNFLQEYPLMKGSKMTPTKHQENAFLQCKCSYISAQCSYYQKRLANFTEIQSRHFISLKRLTQEDSCILISYVHLYDKDS